MASAPQPARLDVPSLLRAARHAADLSQRELAAAAGISQSRIAAYECGEAVDALVLDTLLRACGWALAALDGTGCVAVSRDDRRRDRGGRRYPAHLDVRLTGERGDWWGDYYPGVWGVPPRPTHTFHLDRRFRDDRRAAAEESGRLADVGSLPSPDMDDTALLAIFDRQIRRSVAPEPGFDVELVERPAPLLRLTPVAGAAASWGGGVFWSDLDESTADAAIEATLEHFGPLGREFEWKHYAYDRPADLTDRLRAHGFEPDEEEALVVGEVDEVRDRLAGAADPDGITIRRPRTDPAGAEEDWQGIADLHRAVWDEDGTGMNASIRDKMAADPESTSMWVAVAADGTIVCAARANFHQGTEFASLWGGSTLEQYRGRGIYKALVSRRADEAAQRGFRYLQVDASPDSRPILERLGLRVLTTTTPWMWRPEQA